MTDKTQDSDRTQREFYWMRTLGTLYPDGLNIESDYKLSFGHGHVLKNFTFTQGRLFTEASYLVIYVVSKWIVVS